MRFEIHAALFPAREHGCRSGADLINHVTAFWKLFALVLAIQPRLRSHYDNDHARPPARTPHHPSRLLGNSEAIGAISKARRRPIPQAVGLLTHNVTSYRQGTSIIGPPHAHIQALAALLLRPMSKYPSDSTRITPICRRAWPTRAHGTTSTLAATHGRSDESPRR